MSEVRLVLLDETEHRSGIVHGSVADWFVAALSADPMSITELDAAVDRFALESPPRGHLRGFHANLDVEPWDAGLIVIDLAARVVVVNSQYSAPGPEGAIIRSGVDVLSGRTISLRYRLADEWMFVYDAPDWQATTSLRRQQRAAQPPVDLREIFYGEPMLRFVVNGCLRECGRRTEIAEQMRLSENKGRSELDEVLTEDEQSDIDSFLQGDDPDFLSQSKDEEYRLFYNTIRDLHAEWLMTPCAELKNEIPRAVMRQDWDRLSSDMSQREYEWTILNRCQPGISPESYAFRYSGFNTTEIVLYYSYVREVIWSCWKRLSSMAESERLRIERAEDCRNRFIQQETVRLRLVGEQWLDAPWEEDPDRTPRGLITLERRRQPDGGQTHPIDPDCPCCQAFAELGGIGFWQMDGCNMDDLFAFAFHHDTIETWECEHALYSELYALSDRAQRIAWEWDLPPQHFDIPEEADDVWHLVVTTDNGEIPLGYRLGQIGHTTALLVARIRSMAENDRDACDEQLAVSLQDGFLTLLESCRNSDERSVDAEVDSSLAKFLLVVDGLITFAESQEATHAQQLGHFRGDLDGDGGRRNEAARVPLSRLRRDAESLRMALQTLPDAAHESSWPRSDFSS